MSTRLDARQRIEKHLLPKMKDWSIDDVGVKNTLEVLRAVENGGAVYTAKRLRGYISQIVRFAVACGHQAVDPTPTLRGALKPHKVKSRPTLLNPKDIGVLVRAIRAYDSISFAVTNALQFNMHTFARPTEVRLADWSQIDMDRKEWRIPEKHLKIKGRGDHIVPLSKQALQILTNQKNIYTHQKLVFPGQRKGRPISENTMSLALRALGYSGDTQTVHGFRAMARTSLSEAGWLIDAIERQLAHADKDPLGNAYSRAEYLDIRKEMMQAWSDMLDEWAKLAAS